MNDPLPAGAAAPRQAGQPPTPEEIEELVRRELELLRAEFLTRLPERLQTIEAAWRDGRLASPGGQGLVTFYRLVHTLTGSSGTLGFAELSGAARALEHFVRRTLDQPAPLSPEQWREVESGLQTIVRAAGALGAAAAPPHAA